MIEGIIENVVRPMTTRIGTATSMALTGYGMAQGHASVLGTAATILLGLGCDLMLAWFRKRSIQNKATEKALANG